MNHDAPLLRELLLLSGAALLVLILTRRLRVPAAVGFILTGVLVGPGGLGLVRDAALVGTLAEFGVMFLLFTVGLGLSQDELRQMGRQATLGGLLQMLLTGVATAGVLLMLGQHPARAAFVGMLVSLSSTALVMRVLTDRLEMTAPHGRLATGVLLFQDLMVIPLAVAVPWIAGWWEGSAAAADAGAGPWLEPLARLAAVAVIFMGARRLVPWALVRALRTRSREGFLFGVVLVTIGSAYITSLLGLSLALGAFLAGLVLADTDLRSHVEAGIVSFRDALSAVFFIAIGMLFNPRTVVAYPAIVLASTLGLVLIKAGAAAVALRWAGTPWRIAFAAGVALAQIGEFSLMLAQAAPPGLLSDVGGQAFYAGAVFSMLLTPLLVGRASEWTLALDRKRSERRLAQAARAARHGRPSPVPKRYDHVVIAGFGLNGRNVARVLRSVRLPHVVVDLDPDSLQAGAEQGSEVLLGDITRPEIQTEAGVPLARVLVLALSDPAATRHACQIARSLSESVFVIVRTRYVAEIDELHRLGANQVIPEEFETSIEIFTAALKQFHVPGNVIRAEIRMLREERYSLLRGLKLPSSVIDQLDTILAGDITDTFVLLQHSPAIGRTLADVKLAPGEDEAPHAARVVALVRGGVALKLLDPAERLRVGDTLVLTGSHASMEEAFQRLAPPARRS